jgi:hypothetical protein
VPITSKQHRRSPAELVFRQGKGRHGVDQQHDQRGGDGDEGGVEEEAQEIEALEQPGVVLHRQAHLLHRLAVGNVDAQALIGIVRVDHLRHQPDAAQLRQVRPSCSPPVMS